MDTTNTNPQPTQTTESFLHDFRTQIDACIKVAENQMKNIIDKAILFNFYA